MDRILTEKIKSKVLGEGMDLVGFAPVSRWKNAPFLLSPGAILPEAKTVIVAAMHLTDAWIEMGGEPEPQDKSPGWFDPNSFLDRIAYHTVRLINDYNYKAIAVASSNIWRYRKFDDIPSIFAPDLSHIHAAAAAGLAEIGWSGLAITPEFGVRCRFISVVTEAELVPSPMYNGPALCDMCMECAKHCPTYALKRELGKPHEVEIGGRTFKYANKNIWRCAWAEHFEIDLNSPNLKTYETVGEKELMRELSEGRHRGHERGVCQKVCIPPHLRTREPSFGRDVLIAQNKINKRYPDSMPTLRKMRDDLIAKTIDLGADIVGIGRLDKNSRVGEIVLKEAPGMRTVIGVIIHIPAEMKNIDGWDEYVSNVYNYGFSIMLHHVLFKTARLIEDYGFHAAFYTEDYGFHTSSCTEGYYGFHAAASAGENSVLSDSNYLAEMAGLGTCNKVFCSNEYGEDVITGAVVTDALLDSVPLQKEIKPFCPKSVSSSGELKRQLKCLAEKNYVSLFGVAGADVFDETVKDLRNNIDETRLGESVIDRAKGKHGKWVSEIVRRKILFRKPSDYMKNANSVIVLGMHFPKEIIENAGLEKTKQIGTYAFHQYQTCYELRFAACNIAKYLNERGYKTLITENMLGVGSMVDTPRLNLPDARCNAIEAAAAGLGEIGGSGVLLTPEHGAHQRQIVVITDAKLEADRPYAGEKLCRECGGCKSKCPMKALDEKTFDLRIGHKTIKYPVIDRHRCDWAKMYSLNKYEGPELIGNTTHVGAPDGEITIEDMAKALEKKDTVMKRRSCILEPCIKNCPAGKSGDK